MSVIEILNRIFERLLHQHKEDRNLDYMLRFRKAIENTKSKDQEIAELKKHIQVVMTAKKETESKLQSLETYCEEQIDEINKKGLLDVVDVINRTIYRNILTELRS